MEGPKKIHFHSFDAFRFFAFLKVFILHLPMFAITADLPGLSFFYDHIKHGGGVGVSFFFVLSGFLITYILTYEKLHSDRINLKRFFVRRAFRIWPLFYLVVIIAFVMPPELAQEIGFHTNWGGYEPDWRFSFTFTENYHAIIMDNGSRITPLTVFWSLCIEEHFYILWMVVFFLIKRKWIPYFLLFTVVVACVFRVYEYEIYGNEVVQCHDLFTNLDYFAISGLLGYLVAVNYKKVADFVNQIPLYVRVLYIIGVLAILGFQKDIFLRESWFLDVFQNTIFSIIFALLLLIFIPQTKGLKISGTNVFTRLGKISYGLYVYHLIWIHVLVKIFRNNDMVLDSWGMFAFFAGATFIATVITSYISYRFFEMPILRLRDKWFPSK